MAITALVSLACMSAVGFYLLLIAKFYRLKFARGPKPQWLQLGLGFFLLGMVLRLPWLSFLPPALWQAFLIVGGLVFAGMTYSLYRSMMSPQ